MRLSKKLAAVAIAAGVALTASAAFAYWTTSGSGSGSASTKTGVSVTLTGNAVANLVPGAPKPLTGTVTVSDGATSAYVGTVTPSIDGDAMDGLWNDDSVNPACSASDFAFTSSLHDAQIAAGATGVAFGSIELTDSGANQDNCKDQVLVLSFSSN